MFSGILLFLSGCIIAGLFTSSGFLFKNYKAGVGGHVEAQLNGIFLLLIGVSWHHLYLNEKCKLITHICLQITGWLHPMTYYWVAYTGHHYNLLRQATIDAKTLPSSLDEFIFNFVLVGIVSGSMMMALILLLWGFRVGGSTRQSDFEVKKQ
ncbi:unnamed protein product [Rotaria sp. Silwood1]|nr:unnamed protein product [Rotaria sp. Silwood1]CAF3489731.1 unnamed protein product [Rotaria sp. Silwood1]CAF3566612.1 unnamed protein product [Rotaria sp. Silwood1]CAF4726730.1 unnamed protein product [Rotaria sp. Silwood1]